MLCDKYLLTPSQYYSKRSRDKCSKNDVTLIPKNADVIWRENYANPQNADVTSAAIWGVLSTHTL
jgi:hypothetical protein